MNSDLILVDSSVWISFFGKEIHWTGDFLEQAIAEQRQVCICPAIMQEVLQGLKSDRQFHLVKDLLLALSVLEWDPILAAIHGASLYRSLRKKGYTIRKSNDCLIAAFAQKWGALVLHRDRDFDAMANAGLIETIREV